MDNKLVSEKTKFLKKCIIELTDFLEMDNEKFCQSSRNIAAAKTYLYEAVQTVIFLSIHTIKKYHFEEADTYYNAIEILSKNGKLSTENIGMYVELLDLRSEILFNYEKLNDSNIYDMIQKNTHIFTIFLKDLKSK